MAFRYTKYQINWLKKHYPHFDAKIVTAAFNETYHLNKTVDQIKSTLTRYKIHSGRTGCFEKGNSPYNKGKKGLTGPNKTSFHKGNIPSTSRKLGAERVDSKDGYILIKVKEKNVYTGCETKFKPKHIVLWEKKHGPLPKGTIVIFKDGNNRNFALKNLLAIDRSLHIRLNQLHYKNQPAELKPSIMMLARLKKRTGELRKKRSPNK